MNEFTADVLKTLITSVVPIITFFLGVLFSEKAFKRTISQECLKNIYQPFFTLYIIERLYYKDFTLLDASLQKSLITSINDNSSYLGESSQKLFYKLNQCYDKYAILISDTRLIDHENFLMEMRDTWFDFEKAMITDYKKICKNLGYAEPNIPTPSEKKTPNYYEDYPNLN